MPAQLVENIQYSDSDGLPLVGASIYFGTTGLEPIGNLISIFSDEALTVEISNPQTTDSVGFSGNKVYVSGKYSLRVNTVLGAQFLLDLNVGSAAGAGTTTLDTVLGDENITAQGVSAVVGPLIDKEVYTFVVANTNTGTSGVTLTIDSTDKLPIVKNFNQPLDPGDFEQFQIVRVVFNETSNNYAWVDASVKTKRLTKGSDIPSANSITIPDNDGNYFDITGSITIDTINGVAGTEHTFQTDGAVTFTNSTGLDMRGSDDFTSEAGDVLVFYQLTSTTVINISIGKANGRQVVPTVVTKGGIGTFSTVEVELPVGADEEVLIADSAETTGNKWGPLIVSQGNLNTATGEVSFSNNNASEVFSGLLTLPGGSHGFKGQLKHTQLNGSTAGAILPTNISNASYLNQIILSINGNGQTFTSNRTVTMEERFVQASPPINLGDGVVAGFIFLLINNSTMAIIEGYQSDVPPWLYNGPTNVQPDLIENGKKYMLVEQGRERLSDIVKNPEKLAALVNAPRNRVKGELVKVEITHAIKNADMGLIPHPFIGQDLAGKTVVMLDPMSGFMEDMMDRQKKQIEEEESPLADMFHKGYVKIDLDEKLPRKGPPGINIVAAKLK